MSSSYIISTRPGASHRLFTVRLSGLDLAGTRKPASRVKGGVYAPCKSAACLFIEGKSSVTYRQKARLAGSLISKYTRDKLGLFVKGGSGAAGKIQRLLVELVDKCGGRTAVSALRFNAAKIEGFLKRSNAPASFHSRTGGDLVSILATRNPMTLRRS